MFYRLNNKNKEGDVVEYSTDFDFFISNQIWVSKSGITYHFNSKLEPKNFKMIRNVFGDHTLTDDDIKAHCQLIHNEILLGKHGVGKLVN